MGCFLIPCCIDELKDVEVCKSFFPVYSWINLITTNSISARAAISKLVSTLDCKQL